MQDTYWRNEKDRRTQEDFFTNIYLSLYCKGSKRVTQSLHVTGSWRPNRNCNIMTPKLWPSALCLSRSPGLLNRRPRANSAGWWLSLLHLISIFSGLQLIRASRLLRPDVAFPTTSRLSPSDLQLSCHWPELQFNWLASVLTGLYNSSTPTRSLKSHV